MMPWQQWYFDIAYEYDPDTGLLFYDEDDVTVPRQSGKTTVVRTKKVHRSTVMAARLGPQRSAYYAQTRLAARRKLERDFAPSLRRSDSFREVPHARARPHGAAEWRLSLNNGSEAIEFGNGSLWGIDAPSRTGGHGDTLDDADIDEAFAHEDDTVEGSVRPAQATRVNAKLGVFSTAGDSLSKYLWRKVLAGREACETGQHGRVAYFEWSAPDDADPGDPDVWWACMPALGITITEAFIRGEWDRAQRKGQEGIDTFRRAYLNQWPEIPILEDTSGVAAFPMDLWLELANPDADRGRGAVFGVDVGEDRLAHVAVAWRLPNGAVQVMLADTGLSPLRTPERIADLAKKWRGRVMLGGTAAPLEDEVPAAEVVSASRFAGACGRFDDLLRARRIHHGNQPELNEAVRFAKWRSAGSAGERSLQLRDAPTVGPLAAVIRALAGLFDEKPPPAKPLVEASTAKPSETADLATMNF